MANLIEEKKETESSSYSDLTGMMDKWLPTVIEDLHVLDCPDCPVEMLPTLNARDVKEDASGAAGSIALKGTWKDPNNLWLLAIVLPLFLICIVYGLVKGWRERRNRGDAEKGVEPEVEMIAQHHTRTTWAEF